MAKEDTILKDVKVELKKAIFNLTELYKHAHDFLESRNYTIVEKEYKEKVTAQGREINIKWECEKEVDEYSKFNIAVKWTAQFINDVKVKQGEKEIKMQSGEISVKVSSKLILDYNEKWESHLFLKFLQSFYEKYLYIGTITQLKEKLWEDSWDLYNEIKSFLNIYKFN